MEEMKREHKLTLTGRQNLRLTGVLDVIAFDVKEILLETTEGMLTLRGQDLHVNQLSLEAGELGVDGRICNVSYAEIGPQHAAKKWLGRLLP